MENVKQRLCNLRLLLISIIILSSYSLKSQTDSLNIESNSDDTRWYFSFGISVYSDYISGNPIKVPVYDSAHEFNAGIYQISQVQTFNLATFSYAIRYNIYSFNINNSLSLSVPIALGLNSVKFSDGSRGFLSLSVPCMLQYNAGAASNFSTPKWKGWMLGAGAEFNVFPLVAKDEYAYIDQAQTVKSYIPNHQWIQPAIEIAYRWINIDQNTREINFKFGYGVSQKEKSIDTFSAKLTYLFFINY